MSLLSDKEDIAAIDYLEKIDLFLTSQVVEQANNYDQVGAIPKALLDQAQQIDFFNQQQVTSETLWKSHLLTGYHCSSLRSLQTVNNMGLLALVRFGSEDLKDFYHSRESKQSANLIAFALSEPFAGSQAQDIQLNAEASGNQYILNGEKAWVTGADYAKWILLFAKTNGKGSAFLLPNPWDGLTLNSITMPYSTRAAGAASLTFENCKVPAMFRVGKEGSGLDWVAASCLDLGRFSVAAGALGIAKAALDICVQHVNQYPNQSTPLSQQPQIQNVIAELVTEVQATQALALLVAKKRDLQTSDAATFTTLLKYKAAKVATLCTQQGMQIVGQRAFRGGSTLERLHRDSQCLPLIEGSENINAASIAKAAFRGVFQ